MKQHHEFMSRLAEVIWDFLWRLKSQSHAGAASSAYAMRIRELLSSEFPANFDEVLTLLTLLIIEVDPALLEEFEAAIR